MNKEDFIKAAKRHLENCLDIDMDYSNHDGFLMDWPEEFDGVETHDILFDVYDNMKITVEWDDE